LREESGEEQRLRTALFGLAFFTLSGIWCYSLLGRYFASAAFGVGSLAALVGFFVPRKPGIWRSAEVAGLAALAAIALGHMAYYRDVLDRRAGGLERTDLAPVAVRSADLPHVNAAALADAAGYLRSHRGAIAVVGNEAAVLSLALRRAPVSRAVW